MVGEQAEGLQVRALSARVYVKLIEGASAKGIGGGSIFDAIHAQTARDAGCTDIHTLSVRHFRHVAPDLAVKGL